ncbi:MAG: M42 family peptidase, partial [Trueperaceae bacterium]
MHHDYDLLRTLSETPGVPGRETLVRERIRDALDGVAPDGRPLELRTDAMGNLIIEVPGPEGAPTVMVSAHMDEIGFVVRHVDDKGFLRVQNLGGFDVRN